MTDTRQNALALSDKDFNFVCTYIYEKSGIVLNSNKREMLYRRFSRIIRDRKMPSFSAYCDLLKSKPKEEQQYFINAVTTNLTSFFREHHHFDYLRQHELPRLMKRENKRLRIWSCASSTGEEPYSIAMTVHESLKTSIQSYDVKILATDIDSEVLKTAKTGVYESKVIEGMPEPLKKKYFSRGTGHNSTKVKVAPRLQALLTFKTLNLINDWPMNGPFDVIFCRNVIIYFDKETQLALFKKYHDLLGSGGLLILGHSENLGAFQPYFENVGRTIFRKIE